MMSLPVMDSTTPIPDNTTPWTVQPHSLDRTTPRQHPPFPGQQASSLIYIASSEITIYSLQ